MFICRLRLEDIWIFIQHKYVFLLYMNISYNSSTFLWYVWILTRHKYVFCYVWIFIQHKSFFVCYVWIFLQHKYFFFCKYGYSYKYFLCVMYGYWHDISMFFLLWIWTPQHTAILVHSFAMKIWKDMAHGVFNTSSRPDHFVHDIIDTYKMAALIS